MKKIINWVKRNDWLVSLGLSVLLFICGIYILSIICFWASLFMAACYPRD